MIFEILFPLSPAYVIFRNAKMGP